MRFGTAAVCGGLLALAACVEATPGVLDTVDASYTTGGGEWNTGGGITVAARAIEHGGMVAVCGVWTTDRQSTQTIELNGTIIEAGIVVSAGDKLVENLRFMSQVEYSDNIAGATANCHVTGKPWKPAYATEPAIPMLPRLSFADVDPPSITRISFRPGPRARIIR